MKHIVVLSALIMTSTFVHAGVMPEDLMSPAVEAAADVVDEVIMEKPSFEERFQGLIQFIVMTLLVII